MLNYAFTWLYVVQVLGFYHETWMTFLNYCGQSRADTVTRMK